MRASQHSVRIRHREGLEHGCDPNDWLEALVQAAEQAYRELVGRR